MSEIQEHHIAKDFAGAFGMHSSDDIEFLTDNRRTRTNHRLRKRGKISIVEFTILPGDSGNLGARSTVQKSPRQNQLVAMLGGCGPSLCVGDGKAQPFRRGSIGLFRQGKHKRFLDQKTVLINAAQFDQGIAGDTAGDTASAGG